MTESNIDKVIEQLAVDTGKTKDQIINSLCYMMCNDVDVIIKKHQDNIAKYAREIINELNKR